MSGSNVTGIVPLAQYVTGNAQGNITSVGTLSSLSVSGNITTSANVAGAYFIGDGSALSNLTGANVSGTVANATYALNANSSSYANHANVADLANSVAGGNVVGSVAQANYANIANSVSGSNVSGSVAQANYANIANSVAGANVTGTVPLAEYVTQAAQGNITSLGTLTSLSVGGNTTSGNISAIGNIDGSNLNISNNAVILGNLTVNGNATFFNSNVVTINDKFINLANNASTPAAANGGGIGIGPIASEYATLTYNSTGNVWESNIGFGITGNVTAGYFIGNGSALSSITGANVSGTVANAAYALNAGYVTGNAQANITSVGTLTSLSVSGNITSGNITNNGTITSVGNITAPYFIGNVQGNISGNIDAAGSNTQVQFNDTGDILGASAGFTFNKTSNAVAISGNVAANNVNATNYVAFGTAGGVTTAGPGQMFWDTAEQTVSLGMNNGVTQQIGLENYFLVKASAAITDGQVVMFTGASGNNVEAAPADMSSLNFRPGYVLGVATQNIALNGTGYITAFGQVHGLNTLAYNVGDLLYLDPASTTGGLTATQPAAPNYIIQVGTVTKKSGGDGHIQIIIRINDKVDDLSDTTITSPTNGQVLTWTTGNIWKNAGITAANITAAGSNTQIQFNDGTVLGANANLTYDKATNTFSTGIVSVTGNIGSTQQTIIGTANATASATGNIVVSGKNIATDVVFSPDVSTTTLPTGGRILIGTGVAGNTSLTAWDAQNTLRGARVAIMDAYTKNNSSVVSRELSTWSAVSLDGNITTGTSRIQGVGAVMNFSGGASGNSISYAHNSGGAIGAVNAFNGILNLGGANPNLVTQIGANVSTAYSTGIASVNQTWGAGTYVGNMVGVMSGFFTNNTTSNIRNAIGYSVIMGDNAGSTTGVGNAIGYLFPDYNATAVGTQYGASVGGSFTKGNLYAFMNAGNVAQMRLGSIREQHYYTYLPATTGSITVDAANGMFQAITPTGNITITDFLNFVTYGFNVGLATNVPQYQEVTLAIAQGATPYTVTLPTTAASTGYPITYENNFTAVNATAYGMTYITIKSQPVGVTGGTPWYVSVRQGGTNAAQGAAGANTWVQFNDGNVLGANINFNYNKATNQLSVGNIYAINSTTSAWGNLNAGNIYTVGTNSIVYSAGNITAVNTIFANTVADNGAGSITISTANVFASGNITATKNVYGNIVSAGAYVSTPALYTSDITPPAGGPLQTTTTLSTITGNLSVTGNVTGGNITTAGISNLGSLKTYTEAQYSVPTSGAINIDKLNGQVQYLAPTANVSVAGFINFITTQGGVNQADTVTLIIKQGATPYTVTMPTGYSTIKYAGNLTSIGMTANSVTMAAITGANIGGTATYLVTISPEFV